MTFPGKHISFLGYDRLAALVIPVGLLVSLVITGCSERPATSDADRLFVDDLGRTVTLDRQPERVITLAPNLTELVFAAGAGHLLVGIGLADDYPKESESIPRFSTLPLDFEFIAGLRPDLVLATDHVNNPRDAEMLESLGFPTYYISFNQLDDITRSLSQIGDMLGTSQAAEVVIDSLNSGFHLLRDTYRTLTTRPSVLVLIDDDILYSFGRESYVHEMIDLAGGNSVTAIIDAEAPVLNEEFVLTARPDVIIVTSGISYDPGQLLEHHPTWDILPAVRNERIFGFDPDYILRPGPRLFPGMLRMATLLHQEN